MRRLGSLREEEERAALAAFCPGARLDVAVIDLPDGRVPTRWERAKGAIEELRTLGEPDLIFAPSPHDAHQDHRTIGELVTTVWRDALVLHFEIPKWDGDMGRPSHYVGLSQAEALRKVELLDRHFPSQRGRDWWDDEVFLGLMRLRGMECRHPYAEAFHVSKALLGI